MKWFVAICCIVVALAIHAAILWVRPELLSAFPSGTAHTIVHGACRTLTVAALLEGLDWKCISRGSHGHRSDCRRVSKEAGPAALER